MKKAPVFALLGLIAGSAHAADIVVTGTGLDPTGGDVAYDVVTIDRDRMLGFASRRLEDILRDAGGFQQFRRSDARSAHPTSQGATLRGLGGNASSRALVLLDGVPIADPFGGWINWSALDPGRLHHVRVTRGGGSGVAGAGALAGTIGLESIGPATGDMAEAELSYGSRDSVDARGLVSGGLGTGYAMVSAHYQRSDGFIPIVAEQRGSADEPAPYEQASVAARAVFPVGDSIELQASGLLFTDSRTRGTANSNNRSSGTDTSLRLVGKGSWAWEAAAWLQLRDFSSQFASVDASRSAASLVLDQYNVPATGLGARIQLSPPVSESAELRLGVDFRENHGRTKEHYFFSAGRAGNAREAGGMSRTAGAFADISVDPTRTVTITGGARIDRWWIRDGFLRQRSLSSGLPLAGSAEYPDRSGWESTGRVGVAFRPTDAVTLRAAGYLGWRLPTLNELYRPFRVGSDSTAANPLLDPERLKGIDAGISYHPLPALKLGAVLFWNRLDSAIANITTGTAPGGGVNRKRGNVDAIRAQGAELDGTLIVGAWSLGFSYAYVDARIRASGDAASLDGLRPAQTPKEQFSAHVGWKQGARAFSATLRRVSRQAEDDQNSRLLRSALTVDAAAVWPLASGFNLTARAENIGNRSVETGVNSNGVVERATPRTLWIGVSYRLP